MSKYSLKKIYIFENIRSEENLDSIGSIFLNDLSSLSSEDKELEEFIKACEEIIKTEKIKSSITIENNDEFDQVIEKYISYETIIDIYFYFLNFNNENTNINNSSLTRRLNENKRNKFKILENPNIPQTHTQNIKGRVSGQGGGKDIVSNVVNSKDLNEFKINLFKFLYNKYVMHINVSSKVNNISSTVSDIVQWFYNEIINENKLTINFGAFFEEVLNKEVQSILIKNPNSSYTPSFDIANKKIAIILLLILQDNFNTLNSSIYKQFSMGLQPSNRDYENDFNVFYTGISSDITTVVNKRLKSLLSDFGRILGSNNNLVFHDIEKDTDFHNICKEAKTKPAPFDFIARLSDINTNNIIPFGLIDLKITSLTKNDPISKRKTGSNSDNSCLRHINKLIEDLQKSNKNPEIRFISILQITYAISFNTNKNKFDFNITSFKEKTGNPLLSFENSKGKPEFKIDGIVDTSQYNFNANMSISRTISLPVASLNKEYTKIKDKIKVCLSYLEIKNSDLSSKSLKSILFNKLTELAAGKVTNNGVIVIDFDKIKYLMDFIIFISSKNNKDFFFYNKWSDFNKYFFDKLDAPKALEFKQWLNELEEDDRVLCDLIKKDQTFNNEFMIKEILKIKNHPENLNLLEKYNKIKEATGRPKVLRNYAIDKKIAGKVSYFLNNTPKPAKPIDIKYLYTLVCNKLNIQPDANVSLTKDSSIRSIWTVINTEHTTISEDDVWNVIKDLVLGKSIINKYNHKITSNSLRNQLNQKQTSRSSRIDPRFSRRQSPQYFYKGNRLLNTGHEILGNNLQEVYSHLFKNKLINEGGLAGHMMHPYEALDMTPRQIIDRIKEYSTSQSIIEKVDGQNLFFTVEQDGTLMFARNKEDMTHSDLVEKFTGHPAEKPFIEGGEAIKNGVEQWIQSAGDAAEMEIREIFHPTDDIKSFINFEIMHPDKPNQIIYDEKYIVFHSIIDYVDGRKTIHSSNKGQRLEKIIRFMNSGIAASGFTLASNRTVNLNELSNVQIEDYVDRIKKVAQSLDITEDQYLGEAIENKIKKEIDSLGIEIRDEDLKTIYDFVLYGEDREGNKIKSKDFTSNIIKTDVPKLRNIGLTSANNALKKVQRILSPFKEIFVDLGVDLLKGVKSAYMSDETNQMNIDLLRDKLSTAINDLINYMNENPENYWEPEVHRLRYHLDKVIDTDIEEIVSTSVEGGVYDYQGDLLKVTGGFAPLNQILGAAYRDRKGIFPTFKQKFMQQESNKKSLKNIYKMLF